MLNKIPRLNKALIIIWVLYQSFLIFHFGLHTDLEAAKYTFQANNLITTGGFSAPKYIFYSTLIFIIAFFQKLGAGYWYVAIFQVLINGIATIAFYNLSRQIANSKRIAQIATLLFIIFFPLQLWNLYLYTESLFISLVIFFVYIVHKFPPNSFKNLFINLPFLTLLILTRPFGLLFILPFLIYAFIISKNTFRYVLIGAATLGFISMLVMINYAFKGGEDMDAMKPFKEEHIICFMPNPNPEPLQLSITNNPVYDIFFYIFHNPSHFVKLMGKRLLSFFSLTRPYYSLHHNLFLAIFIIPIYTFALYFLFSARKKFNAKIIQFILLLILLYTLGTTFQCDDYHSRFIMPLIPFIFLFSTIGYCEVYNNFFKKSNSVDECIQSSHANS